MSRSLSTAVFVLAAGLPACAARVSSQAILPLDSARLLADLAVLAHDSMEGRATGTPGNLRARTFLERVRSTKPVPVRRPAASRDPSNGPAAMV
jgi:hypothetical protein